MEEDGRIIRNKASFKLTPEAKAQYRKKAGKAVTSEAKKKTESTKRSESTKKVEPKKTASKQTKTEVR